MPTSLSRPVVNCLVAALAASQLNTAPILAQEPKADSTASTSINTANSSAANSFPEMDYTALGDAGYANRLSLSEQQVAEIQKILAARRSSMITTLPAERPSVLRETNEQLRAILTDNQKTKFSELVAGNKLRFTFRNEPWPDVLSWFASQADLALVMNEAPAGVFNYSDATNHTPSEAIDLLNGALQGKGFTLVRRGKMLIVSPTSNGVAYDQVPKVEPSELDSRGQFEFVSVLLPLEGRPVDNVLKEVNAFLGTNGKATALPSTGQIMVVDTAGRVQDIRKLIDSMPKPAPKKKSTPKDGEENQEEPKRQPPVFQVHSAEGLDVDRAVETLRKLYGEKVAITGDAKAKQLNVYAPANLQKAIDGTIKQMQKNVSGDNRPTLKTYSIVERDLDQLRDLLSQSNPGIQISTDPANNQLFVVADSNQHKQVLTTLRTLEAVAVDGSESVAIYEVRDELVSQVVELVKPLIPRASVVANGNKIAVRGSQQDLEIAKSAIDQLDAAERNEEKPSLRFVNLKQKLERTYFDSVRQLAPKARISEVPDRNQLAIVATPKDYQRVLDAITQIESELGEEAKPELQQFNISVDDPDRMLSMLKNEFRNTQMLLNQKQDTLLVWSRPALLPELRKKIEELTAILPAKRNPIWQIYPADSLDLGDMQSLVKPLARNAQFKPEPQRKRLMIWATPEEHEKIASTLSAFRGDDTNNFKDVLLGYPINRSDVGTVVSMLQGLRPDIKFAADETANRILVTAPLAEQTQIKAIITQLDTAPNEPTGDIAKTYTVDALAASTVVQLLQPDIPKMRMSPNGRNIAAIGSAHDHKKLEAAIQQFDDNPDEKSVVAYDVSNASVDQVRSVLQQLLPAISVSTNESARTVVVWATEAEHKKAKQAIEQFTKEGTSRRTTEVYRFDRTDNYSVERLFERLAPRARVSRVYGSNSVIATATPEEHAMFREAVEKLQGSAASVTRVYAIEKDRLNVDDVLASIDDSLKSRLSIRMNEQMNSLIVRGPEEDQTQIKQLIDELVDNVPEPKKQIIKVYALEHADPDTARYLVGGLFPNARLTEDDEQRTLAASALLEDHEQIAKVIEQIDVPGPQTEQITEVYRFDRMSGRSAENVFNRVAPRARVSFLSGSNSVIATGTEAEHTLLREVALKMNGTGSASVTRVYPMDKRQIDVEDVLASIDESLRSRVALRMNEQTNSLMVRGSEEDQAAFKQLIDEIIAQVPPKENRVAKIYSFTHTDSDNARYILRDLFEDARFTSDDATGTLAVTATEDQHTQIAEVVKQMDVPGQKSRQTTEIYRFDRADGRAARDAFERIAPRARVSYIDGTNSVMATASEDEHVLLKQATEKMNGGEGASVTKVYALDKEQLDAEDLFESIDDSLRSRLAIRINEQTNSVIVRGNASDQKTLKGVIDEIIAQVPPKEQRTTRVYPFQYGNARSARYSLRIMFDDAYITYDDDTNTLYATANDKEHEAIEAIVKQMDTPGASEKSTKVYQVNTASAGQVYPAISELVDDGRVSYDSDSNVLIVTATAAEHKQVQGVLDDLNKLQGENVSTEVYTLKSANPTNIQNSLERLMPQIRVASDGSSSALIVEANEADQNRVASLVQQLDKAPGQESLMKAYAVKGDNARQIYDSLTRTFNGNGNFSISFQEPTNTIFLVATPKNHAIFTDLMNQLDKPELAANTRTAKTYALTNLSGNAARAAITGLLQGTSPAPNIEIDELGNSLIIVGTNEQHQRVAGTLNQLAGADSELEVFDLEFVDPWTVESAMDSLFANQPASAAPTMTSDYFSSRLFVRGNQKQIDQIRGLLVKMGETSVSPRAESGGGGDVRTIPFRGDVAEAISQVQKIWPRMRQNRIEVVAPASKSPVEIDDTSPPATQQPPHQPLLRPQIGSDEEDNSVLRTTRQGTRYVALQTTTRAAAQENTPSKRSDIPTKDDEDDIDLSVPSENASNNGGVTSSGIAIDSPVVVVPEDGQITIASSDHEALDQLEELFRAISRSSTEEASSYGSDFAVFLLRNTGAGEMRQLLGDLFEQLRKSDSRSSGFGGRERPGSSGSIGFGGFNPFGPSFGNVAVVADDRLNALIIHGDRRERELIKELLRVLDTKDLANPIVVHQPELVRLKNTQADRVLGILKNVYKSQLQTGGGRKKVEIPEGVSTEVASVLQQINAAAGAPVLTLDVDSTTNSIVMRAPPELRQEIKTFVSSLDNGAGANRSRNVRVIRLQRGKSDQIREALQEFILERARGG